MKSPVRFVLFVIVLMAIFLAACGAPAATPTHAPPPPPVEQDVMPAAMATAPALYDGALQSPAGAPSVAENENKPGGDGKALDPNTVVETGNTTLPDVMQPKSDHMIIKNADVRLQVESTDTAIDRSTQIIGDLGGYIISSRVWYQDYYGTSYKYATISMGVPVDQFENAMRRLRGLAVKVLDENASGQDVTNEFVDLQSQLGNLEATRDRIRSFLADAKTVEESLRINQELANIEDQIEKVKGRMTYLSGRSAYSTITVNLEPKLPDVVPTATLTPTPTSTPKPTATPTAWNPGKTLDVATGTVVNAYQGITEMLIWVIIVLVPILVPPAFILWAIWKFARRKGNKPASGG